ncbi:hypothetical protein AN958_06094 [Leucoagaricus sp. SymC.cos]|nr:hypothetical protein AN958_06094 [Leucoagaricus sp. SymC.cos]
MLYVRLLPLALQPRRIQFSCLLHYEGMIFGGKLCLHERLRVILTVHPLGIPLVHGL